MGNSHLGGEDQRINCCDVEIDFVCKFEDAIKGKGVCLFYEHRTDMLTGCRYFAYGNCTSKEAQAVAKAEVLK